MEKLPPGLPACRLSMTLTWAPMRIRIRIPPAAASSGSPPGSLFGPAHKGGVHKGLRARLEAAGGLKTICDESQECVIALRPSGMRDAYQRVIGAAGKHQQKKVR